MIVHRPQLKADPRPSPTTAAPRPTLPRQTSAAGTSASDQQATGKTSGSSRISIANAALSVTATARRLIRTLHHARTENARFVLIRRGHHTMLRETTPSAPLNIRDCRTRDHLDAVALGAFITPGLSARCAWRLDGPVPTYSTGRPPSIGSLPPKLGKCETHEHLTMNPCSSTVHPLLEFSQPKWWITAQSVAKCGKEGHNPTPSGGGVARALPRILRAHGRPEAAACCPGQVPQPVVRGSRRQQLGCASLGQPATCGST